MSKIYAIINLSDLDKIDFNQISETSKNTIRKNILEPPTQFVIKWREGNTPTFISDGSVNVVGSLMNHKEALELMNTSNWLEPISE